MEWLRVRMGILVEGWAVIIMCRLCLIYVVQHEVYRLHEVYRHEVYRRVRACQYGL